MDIDKLKIEYRPVASLTHYERNSRTHSDHQVDQIVGSIREFGWTNPVLVDGANGIIAGHGRVMAARRMGMDTVPVIELDGLTETQKRAYVLADNKLALNAGWDDGLLDSELDWLGDAGFDLDLIGFSEQELSDLMGGSIVPLDAMPELPDGERSEYRQMTFTLHSDQAEIVNEAIDKAKAMGVFAETENDNSNGNALARICEMWIEH